MNKEVVNEHIIRVGLFLMFFAVLAGMFSGCYTSESMVCEDKQGRRIRVHDPEYLGFGLGDTLCAVRVGQDAWFVTGELECKDSTWIVKERKITTRVVVRIQ